MAIEQCARIIHIQTRWNTSIMITYGDEGWELGRAGEPTGQTGGTTNRVVSYERTADITMLPAWAQLVINSFWDDPTLTALYADMKRAEAAMHPDPVPDPDDPDGPPIQPPPPPGSQEAYEQSVNAMKIGMMVDLTGVSMSEIIRGR